MVDIRTILDNLYRLLMYKDELISLHETIQALTRRVQKQDRVIRRLREHNTLSKRQIKYIRRTFRMFLLLRAAPFFRNGHWVGAPKSDVGWLNDSISPIIRMFKLCDWRRTSAMLHDVEYHTSVAFMQVVRSRLLHEKVQALYDKVHTLRANGVFRRGLDVSLPYLGSTYRVKWIESDIRFDEMRRMDVLAFALPIRKVHSHVAFLFAACAEFSILCGITSDVSHHALCECVVNAISISK